MQSPDIRGSTFAIISGFLYGFVGYFGLSVMHSSMSAATMVFWRFLISSLIMVVVLLPQWKKIQDSFKSIVMAFLSGALFYAVSTILYFMACHYISSGLAMVIMFTYPVLVMLVNNQVYNQFIPKSYYSAIGVILIGMVLLINPKTIHFDMVGILLGLGSSFFYACYIVSSKRNTVSPQVSTLMISVGCTLTAFLFSLSTHSFTTPANLSIWFYLMGIAVVSTVIPVLLLLYSLKYISSEKASILSVLEPVFVVIFGVLLLGETLQLWQATGIVFVLAGALIALFNGKVEVLETALSTNAELQ